MIRKVKAHGKTRHKVFFREPGSRTQKSRTFDTPEQAKAFEGQVAQAKAGIIEFPKAKISNLTLSQFSREFKIKHLDTEIGEGTRKSYRSVWNNHVQPKLGPKTLTALTSSPDLVQGFKAELTASGIGDPTIAKALALVSVMLNKAVEWGHVPANGARVKKPRPKRARKPQAYPLQKVAQLIEHMPTDRDKLITALLGYAGLRPGEVLALTTADIGVNVINVDKALAFGSEKDTKTHVNRHVPILPELRPYLTGVPDGKLFPRAKDGEYWKDHDYRNWRADVFQPAIDRAALGTLKRWKVQEIRRGKKVKLDRRQYLGPIPYDLRHGFASRLLMNGCSPLEVAEVMGNSVEVLLHHYAHVIAEMRFSNLTATA